MVEDIITALSRNRLLFVIARNSSFTYKGRAVDVKQVGRELGVRYVMEGSVRKAANRVRITGQLVDAHDRRCISGPITSKARSTTSSNCRTGSPSVWSARSCRRWNVPRSNVPSANPPRTCAPTTIICAAWRPFGDQRTHRRSVAHVHQGDRARSGLRVGLRDGGVVLLLAQAQRLDGRSRAGGGRRYPAVAARCRTGQGRRRRPREMRYCAPPFYRRA